jgi:hypothetical protein
MKKAKDIALTDFKYFIVQDDSKNAVAIISESEDSVTFCNLTLLPYVQITTGEVKLKLGAYPETPIRVCENPTFRDNVQIGIMRSMIDLTKDHREVERILKYNKGTEIISSHGLMQGQI